MKRKCKHEGKAIGVYGRPGETLRMDCRKCDARGVSSLGRSNDKPLEVQVEIDAASYAASYAAIYMEDNSWGGRLSGYGVGYNGWFAHANGSDIPLAGDAGWLAREVTQVVFLGTHDFGHDHAWSWSISRPIADQLAETARVDETALEVTIETLDRGNGPEPVASSFVSPSYAEAYEASRTAEPDCRDDDESENERSIASLAAGIVEAGGALPYPGTVADASSRPDCRDEDDVAGLAGGTGAMTIADFDAGCARVETALGAMVDALAVTVAEIPTPRCICDAEAPSPAVALSHGWTFDGGVWRCNHWRSDVGDEPVSEVVP